MHPVHDQQTGTHSRHPTDTATHRRAVLAGIGGLAAGALLTGRAQAGPLDPPAGPIAPTPGPEPRIPINAQNTPGDSQALFRITQPGSYYLTGNITGISGRNGLTIAADNVTVDLMGYALIGVPGSLNGINAASGVKHIHIRNGILTDWDSNGVVLLSNNSRVSDIIAVDNEISGMFLGSQCSIANSTASNNGSRGIITAFDCSVSNCSCSNNGSDGISLGQGGMVVDSVATLNAQRGIRVNATGTVLSCVARGNGSHGIETSWASVVSHRTSAANSGFGIYTLNGDCSITDCTTRANTQGGVRVFQRSIVRGNNCSGHSEPDAPGILMASSRNRIESNQCAGNTVGIRSTSNASMIFANTCNGNNTNWEIAASNYCWAPSMFTTSPINGANGGGSSPFGGGTPDPLANFSY